MCAQKHRILPRSHEECVLHIPGRMFRREVEGFENVIVVLDFRTFCDIVAEFAENLDDFLPDNGYRMTGSQIHDVSGKTAIHGRLVLSRH